MKGEFVVRTLTVRCTSSLRASFERSIVGLCCWANDDSSIHDNAIEARPRGCFRPQETPRLAALISGRSRSTRHQLCGTRKLSRRVTSLTELESNEEALGLDLIGGDWVEFRIVEGLLKMSNGGLYCTLRTAFGGLPWRRTNRCQSRANSRLGLKKPFPNSVDSRVAHRAAKFLEGL